MRLTPSALAVFTASVVPFRALPLDKQFVISPSEHLDCVREVRFQRANGWVF